jgi:hypothetical protein
VLVAADSTGSAKAQVGGFLLDVWCLGVKNAMPPKPMTPRQLAEHKNTYFNNFGGQVQVPAELAQALVFGAAAYARELGFEPEADFNAAAALLGQPAGSSPIRFGRDGEPFYVSGPYDDVEAIMQTLRRTAGRDSFHADGAFPKESRRRLFRRGR